MYRSLCARVCLKVALPEHPSSCGDTHAHNPERTFTRLQPANCWPVRHKSFRGHTFGNLFRAFDHFAARPCLTLGIFSPSFLHLRRPTFWLLSSLSRSYASAHCNVHEAAFCAHRLATVSDAPSESTTCNLQDKILRTWPQLQSARPPELQRTPQSVTACRPALSAALVRVVGERLYTRLRAPVTNASHLSCKRTSCVH